MSQCGAVKPSRDAQELFNYTLRRLLSPHIADRLWQRILDDSQRRRLGGSFHRALRTYRYAHVMWAEVMQVNQSLAVIEVAERLNLITAADADYLRCEGGELPRDPSAAQAQACDRGDLVLNRSERSFYWRNEEYCLRFDRHPVLWDFWETACRAAQNGDGIDPDSFGNHKRDNYVTQTKSKLSQLDGFPIDLIDKFVDDGPRRQRLHIPANHIHIFD